MPTEPFKFTLVSDLHVNHPQLKTPYELLERCVVVAGDTSNGLEGLKFLNKLQRKGHKVIAVDGNHEHYMNKSQQRTAYETRDRFRQEFPPVVQEHINFPVFICTNGWYPVSNFYDWDGYMNDSRYCDLDHELANIMCLEESEFVRTELSNVRRLGRKAVVVTHTAPCMDTLDPYYKEHYSNEWYWNPNMKPLLSEFADTILCWCHGHVHKFADKIVDGVRVVCNPRGYPGENPNWKPLTIEV